MINISSAGLALIATKGPLTVVSATIDFANIPASWQHLYLVGTCRCDDGAAEITIGIQANGDGAGNYDNQRVDTLAAVATASQANATTSARLGTATGGTAAAGLATSIAIWIPGYIKTTLQKIFLSSSGAQVGVGAGNFRQQSNVGCWRSTAAINRLTLVDVTGGNFDVGSFFSLYGAP